jgi:imidazolonepropionase-like amidohydrolase
LLPAEGAVDIERMVNLAADLKMPAVLYGGHGAARAADVLKRSRTPILVNLKWPERSKDADPDEPEPLRVLEMRDSAPAVPAALAKAGVQFAFYSGNPAKPRDAIKSVKRAVDAGLSLNDAVRALTLSVAEIYGVADRLGSIDKGKIANFVITEGPLFEDKTKVKYIFVDGAKYEPVTEEPPAGSASEKTQ